MSDERWSTVLTHLVAALPADAARVTVDGLDGGAAVFADRFAAWLRAGGRDCERFDGADGRSIVMAPTGGHLTIWVRSPGPGEYRGEQADAVVDLHDPAWPVLRHLNPALGAADTWYRSESQAFFAARAATWDTKFGDDQPAYAAAVAEAGLRGGGVVVDLGCGTGRALPALRQAAGPAGVVIGVDLTPQMLAAAGPRARECAATLLLADARSLPFVDAGVDAIFAAGLINHLPDADAGLAELARITRPGGKLVLFHPSGRAAVAARHGRTLRPDEPLAEPVLRASAARAGWCLTSYDDPPHRFHAVAVRT
ncbi:class I SAM-dependent methyltransferase [Dactylosporangium sp. AC04546]|uniref:class I SAM-dependent methyltransferase n=1 Tax=Dactylosporangium sp. AC04546 TaxID=2862460 RepID=UPI001EDD19AC|nr:class I SAM-dependent methyltransferase [Dactylosporangium sp. AC04546]WVK79646.1 class I SAM-dependent methyltransferase [Dactylosporangium sp. AC04546]